MGDPPGNGERRTPPRIPTGVFLASLGLALVAVSGLILLLYRETRGPGEILRRFARAVDAGDCPESYDLLAPSVTARVTENVWCTALPTVDGQIDADFTVRQAVLRGDRAEVHIEGTETEVWLLERHGERSWRVVGPEEQWSFTIGTGSGEGTPGL